MSYGTHPFLAPAWCSRRARYHPQQREFVGYETTRDVLPRRYPRRALHLPKGAREVGGGTGVGDNYAWHTYATDLFDKAPLEVWCAVRAGGGVGHGCIVMMYNLGCTVKATGADGSTPCHNFGHLAVRPIPWL